MNKTYILSETITVDPKCQVSLQKGGNYLLNEFTKKYMTRNTVFAPLFFIFQNINLECNSYNSYHF